MKSTEQDMIQQERLSAIENSARGIAHDFNNALMPVLGFSELLIASPELLDDKEEALGILQDIHSSAQKAMETIRLLRVFYRPADETEYTMVDFKKLVESVVELTQPKWKDELEKKGITTNIQTELQQVPSISGNESQLREALTNLILNSIDAMPNGGTITIRSYADSEWITLEVSDTGVGMTEDVLRHCLEPFFSGKGSHGKGMGLAVAHGIMRQHGGVIDIESQSGKGTTTALHFKRLT